MYNGTKQLAYLSEFSIFWVLLSTEDSTRYSLHNNVDAHLIDSSPIDTLLVELEQKQRTHDVVSWTSKIDTIDFIFYFRPRVGEIYILEKLSLLGLLAKIMCSICSFQLNIWNAAQWVACILNWFLQQGHGLKACFGLATGWLGIALPPRSAHIMKYKKRTSKFGSNNTTRHRHQGGRKNEVMFFSLTFLTSERLARLLAR